MLHVAANLPAHHPYIWSTTTLCVTHEIRDYHTVGTKLWQIHLQVCCHALVLFDLARLLGLCEIIY